MTDFIKRAQELVQEFDGKITEGDWDVGVDFCGILTNRNIISYYQVATEADIDAMSSVPEMLAVIKGLLEELSDIDTQKQRAAGKFLDQEFQILKLKDKIAELIAQRDKPFQIQPIEELKENSAALAFSEHEGFSVVVKRGGEFVSASIGDINKDYYPDGYFSSFIDIEGLQEALGVPREKI